MTMNVTNQNQTRIAIERLRSTSDAHRSIFSLMSEHRGRTRGTLYNYGPSDDQKVIVANHGWLNVP